MVTITVDASDLKALADPVLIARAQLEMLEGAVDVLIPLSRAEAPSRTGRGRMAITGRTYPGGNPYGRVYVGKGAFYLPIIAAGTYKKPGGYLITTRTFRSKTKARRTARALGPGKATGALQALRFKIGGAYMFRLATRHPGLRPDDFFARAARSGEEAVSAAGDRAMQRNLDRATHG